jgi:hypothetical protein
LPAWVVSMCWESTRTLTLGLLLPDRPGGACAFVGERGRHPDVDDGEFGLLPCDGGEQLVGVAEGGDHVCPLSWKRRARPSRSRAWSSAITTRMGTLRRGWCRGLRPLSIVSCSLGRRPGGTGR